MFTNEATKAAQENYTIFRQSHVCSVYTPLKLRRFSFVPPPTSNSNSAFPHRSHHLESDKMTTTNTPSCTSTPIDRTRLTFADLPGELRNVIYALALVSDSDPGTIRLGVDHNELASSETDRACKSAVAAFVLMRSLNHHIRYEAETFFFSNNEFLLRCKGEQTWKPTPNRPAAPVPFFNWIGQRGRSRLRGLVVSFEHEYRSLGWEADRSRFPFYQHLGQCAQLTKISYPVSLYELFGDDDDARIGDLFKQTPTPTVHIQRFVDQFHGLAQNECLQLELYCFLEIRACALALDIGGEVVAHGLEIQKCVNDMLAQVFSGRHQRALFNFVC